MKLGLCEGKPLEEKIERMRHMTGSKKNGIMLLLLLFLLFPAWNVSAFAVEPDSKKFVIDVDLNVPNSEKVYDTQISLYHVATAEIDETGNLHMEPIKLYKDLVFDNYTEDKAPILLEQLCGRLQQPESVPEASLSLAPIREEKPGRDGKIHFDNLEAGVYLLVKWEGTEPTDLNMLPIMVYLPSYYHQNNHWEHTVTVIPKFDWKPDDQPDKQPPTGLDTKLPQTGMVQWPVPVLVFAGLLLIVIGYRLHRREK